MIDQVDRGTFYVVGTPIGNLGDLTFRAKEILASVELVAAEDTRRTRRLLASLGISKKVISCHKYNERERVRLVCGHLARGEDVAMVSDAGTPNLSDPGAALVRAVVESGFKVVPIPGVSAITTLLSVAAMAADSFMFGGFLPSKRSARQKCLEKFKDIEVPIVFFEAPHRLVESLEDMENILGDRDAVIGRELTKLHETIIYGKISQLRSRFEGGRVQGEITIAISGRPRDELDHFISEPILGEVLDLVTSERRVSVKKSVDLISSLTGKPRKEIYRLALKGKGELDD